MRFPIRFVFVLLIGLLATACGRAERVPLRGLFGGEEGLRIVSAAATVEAYLIDPAGGDGLRDDLSGYVMRVGPVEVPADVAASIRTALMDARSYEWKLAKACVPRYGPRLRFSDPGGTVDVLLCFTCDELVVFRDAKKVGAEDFDPMRPTLVDAVKRLFPDDAEIQALQPQR